MAIQRLAIGAANRHRVGDADVLANDHAPAARVARANVGSPAFILMNIHLRPGRHAGGGQ